MRQALLILAVVVLGVLIGGCGSSELQPETALSTEAATPSADTTPVPAAAQAALDTWTAFRDAVTEAERHPFDLGETPSPAADFSRYTWEPARAQFARYIAGLKQEGVAFRGTPYTSHARVVQLRLDADPLPLVLLSDCLTGDDWVRYDVRTGRPVPPQRPSAVPPPYPGTIAVVRNGDRWGVSSVTFDGTRTCAG